MYSEQALSWALARLNLTYYVVLPSLVNGSITSENQNQKEKYFPPPGGVRGWVRGYGGVGLLWDLVLGVRAAKTTIERVSEFGVLIF